MGYKEQIVNGVTDLENWGQSLQQNDNGTKTINEDQFKAFWTIVDRLNPALHECVNPTCNVTEFQGVEQNCPNCGEFGKDKGRMAK